MNRGDVLLARFPHPSGGRGKKRPVVVVQADAYNRALRTLVVVEVTKNLILANDPACLFIDSGTPEGQATGVLQDSVVSCLLMATIKAHPGIACIATPEEGNCDQLFSKSMRRFPPGTPFSPGNHRESNPKNLKPWCVANL
jgi:mRNA-degrading endonuclease toxin of MazEF toxin-antitoxin module